MFGCLAHSLTCQKLTSASLDTDQESSDLNRRQHFENIREIKRHLLCWMEKQNKETLSTNYERLEPVSPQGSSTRTISIVAPQQDTCEIPLSLPIAEELEKIKIPVGFEPTTSKLCEACALPLSFNHCPSLLVIVIEAKIY